MKRTARSLLTLGVATLMLGSALTAADAKDRDEKGKFDKGKKEARHDVRRGQDHRGPAWRPGPVVQPRRIAEHRDWDGHPRVDPRVFDRRPDVHWRFDRGRYWRWEPRPGVWSAPYSWWWVNRQVVLLAAPTVTVVQYPQGRYELRGDGVSVPYYWVWVPVFYAAAPPPPLPPPPPPPLG